MSLDKSKDLLPLLIILESIGKIEVYAKNFDEPIDFYQADDQVKFNASLLLLSNIGEYSHRVSNELKSKYSEIDWKNIKNLRNRIAHDYIGIDFEMVFEMIRYDIPALKSKIENVISIEIKKGIFLIEEIDLAKASIYYKHVSFNEIIP
jgi:uncharacterized protein with HEPN domain